jgi:signal transduction histidine kinase
MLAPFSISSTIKKFLFLYFSAMTVAIAIMSLVYTIYMNYISGVIKDLSRNPVMIHDTFSLRQSIVPLIKDDILEIKIFDSVGSAVFNHAQDGNAFFSYINKYEIFEKDNFLYSIHLKMNLWKYIFIILIFGAVLSFGYYPFARYEQKEYQNRSNQLLADLSKKLAHDIRTPISTLNLISSRISDQNIKDLQLAVVKQINLISENLLNTGKNQNGLYSNSETYSSLISQISQEYDLRHNQSRKVLFFEIDKQLINYSAKHSKILYPIICNIINNSIEAIDIQTGRIDVQASLDAHLIKFTFRDNGKGMPTEILAKIGSQPLSFGKKYSLNSGNGIALYNAKKDIESINGSLKIQSVLNQFTEVEIRIPISH